MLGATFRSPQNQTHRVHQLAKLSRRSFSAATSTTSSNPAPSQPRKKFDPTKIFPTKVGSVRICSNTTRDAQQSNLSAEMAARHRHQIASLIDDCYASISGPPGVEQIWGGTIPMFDIWKRGVHPFDSLRTMTAMLPNTPTSMLVRSNSLNSMNSQPRDVIDNFIKMSVEAGINVFTNFDANNDIRNHVAVAEAVHKYGQHYQAALSWAVYKQDPTIYNVRWVVNWFRQLVHELKPHSLYVKDPSGNLTPEMAGVISRELKAEFPDLPLVFHSHYQTGFAYATYLEAMLNGANAVECSLGFPDGAGQPYSLTMLRMAEDYGLETGNPDKSKLDRINVLCKKELRPLYSSANVVRTPDIDVEKTGIAGGQRSILDKELTDAGQPHLIPKVDEMVQQVRKEGGLVCLVTPAADSFVRESMRRLRGGNELSGFTPGYAQILYGENGSTKEPVNATQRAAALDERIVRKLKEMVENGKITQDVANMLQGKSNKKDNGNGHDESASLPSTVLSLWRRRLDELSAPVIDGQRRVEVESRIEELKYITTRPELLASLNRKISMAQCNSKEGSIEREIGDVQARIKVLEKELSTLPKVNDTATKTYHDLLLGRASDSAYVEFINMSPLSQSAHASGSLTIPMVKALLSHGGTITCSSSLMLTNSLGQSRRELEAFDQEHCLGLLDTPQKAEENTLLWACFSKAAIPNLIQNFFLHYYTGDIAGFFPKLYHGDKGFAGETRGHLKAHLAKLDSKNSFLYRQVHKTIDGILKTIPNSSSKLSALKDALHTISVLEYRLEVWNDTNNSVSSLIAPETKEKLKRKIDGLKKEVAQGEEEFMSTIGAYLRSHPDTLRTSFPTYDPLSGGIVFTPSANDSAHSTAVATAREALKQIIRQK